MSSPLLDANLSPDSVVFLSTILDLGAVPPRTLGLGELFDDDAVALAKRKGGVIINLDLGDRGIDERWEWDRIGSILLRTEDQAPSSLKSVLDRFFSKEAAATHPASSLVVLERATSRVTNAC